MPETEPPPASCSGPRKWRSQSRTPAPGRRSVATRAGLAKADRSLRDGLGRRAGYAPYSRPIARQLLGLSFVRRPRIVNAAQNAAIHQVPGWLLYFPITFLASRHGVLV